MQKPSQPNASQSTVLEPVLSETLAQKPLSFAIQTALEQHADVDCIRFTNDEAAAVAGGSVEFSTCMFERCAFSNWDLKRVSFIDCLFDHCDLSGLRLENVTFQRVRFANCRLTGAEFLRASMMNVTLEGCSADYFTLSESKTNRLLLKDCRFQESIWQDIKLKYTAFTHCDLTRAQIRYMPMDGLDMTTCTLDSIQVDPHDLRGLKVSAVQGLMFCSLLGLKVVE